MSQENGKPPEAAIDGHAEEIEPDTQPQPVRPPERGLALAPRAPAEREVLMPLDPEQVVEGMRQYQRLLRDLLEPSDWQTEDKHGRPLERPFLKKSGWRKIARAFNLSFERVRSEVERDEHGNPVRAEVWIRAVAPNGQYGDGDGYCSLEEGRFRSRRGRAKLENDLRATACVPLRAEVLTRDGFRAYNEVHEGDPVLAYDVAADKCRWTPLRRVTVYRDAQLVRLGNRQTWSTVCTPNHSWAIEHDTPRVRVPQRCLAKADELPARGRLINAAPAECGPCAVSERDAAIVGWLITDGRVTWDAFYPRAMIYQSKEPYVEELRELVGREAREDFDDRPPRTFPSGRTYPVKRAFRWTLTTAALKGLMDRTGVYSRRDVIPFVTHIDAKARRAMLDAMLKAEGSSRGRAWDFTQVARDVLDVFQILATLEGAAVGRERRDGKRTRVTLRAWRATDIPRLTVEPEFPEDVWCPTTDYGTWVMRLDGLVSITGNTTRAKNRAIADLVGMGEVSAEELEAEGESRQPAGPGCDAELARAASRALVYLAGGNEAAEQIWNELAELAGGQMPALGAQAIVLCARALRGRGQDGAAGPGRDAAQAGEPVEGKARPPAPQVDATEPPQRRANAA